MASAFASLRAPPSLSRWWSSKSAGEQWIVAGLALVVLAALAWWAVWQPLSRDIVAMRATNLRANAALADARRMSADMAGLARQATVTGDVDARADLERLLVQHNLRAALTQQDWKEGRARLVFGAVNYEALVAGLEALQRDVRLRVVEATLTARVEPGTVRAELVLAR